MIADGGEDKVHDQVAAALVLPTAAPSQEHQRGPKMEVHQDHAVVRQVTWVEEAGTTSSTGSAGSMKNAGPRKTNTLRHHDPPPAVEVDGTNGGGSGTTSAKQGDSDSTRQAGAAGAPSTGNLPVEAPQLSPSRPAGVVNCNTTQEVVPEAAGASTTEPDVTSAAQGDSDSTRGHQAEVLRAAGAAASTAEDPAAVPRSSQTQARPGGRTHHDTFLARQLELERIRREHLLQEQQLLLKAQKLQGQVQETQAIRAAQEIHNRQQQSFLNQQQREYWNQLSMHQQGKLYDELRARREMTGQEAADDPCSLWSINIKEDNGDYLSRPKNLQPHQRPAAARSVPGRGPQRGPQGAGKATRGGGQEHPHNNENHTCGRQQVGGGFIPPKMDHSTPDQAMRPQELHGVDVLAAGGTAASSSSSSMARTTSFVLGGTTYYQHNERPVEVPPAVDHYITDATSGAAETETTTSNLYARGTNRGGKRGNKQRRPKNKGGSSREHQTQSQSWQQQAQPAGSSSPPQLRVYSSTNEYVEVASKTPLPGTIARARELRMAQHYGGCSSPVVVDHHSGRSSREMTSTARGRDGTTSTHERRSSTTGAAHISTHGDHDVFVQDGTPALQEPAKIFTAIEQASTRPCEHDPDAHAVTTGRTSVSSAMIEVEQKVGADRPEGCAPVQQARCDHVDQVQASPDGQKEVAEMIFGTGVEDAGEKPKRYHDLQHDDQHYSTVLAKHFATLLVDSFSLKNKCSSRSATCSPNADAGEQEKNAASCRNGKNVGLLVDVPSVFPSAGASTSSSSSSSFLSAAAASHEVFDSASSQLSRAACIDKVAAVLLKHMPEDAWRTVHLRPGRFEEIWNQHAQIVLPRPTEEREDEEKIKMPRLVPPELGKNKGIKSDRHDVLALNTLVCKLADEGTQLLKEAVEGQGCGAAGAPPGVQQPAGAPRRQPEDRPSNSTTAAPLSSRKVGEANKLMTEQVLQEPRQEHTDRNHQVTAADHGSFLQRDEKQVDCDDFMQWVTEDDVPEHVKSMIGYCFKSAELKSRSTSRTTPGGNKAAGADEQQNLSQDEDEDHQPHLQGEQTTTCGLLLQDDLPLRCPENPVQESWLRCACAAIDGLIAAELERHVEESCRRVRTAEGGFSSPIDEFIKENYPRDSSCSSTKDLTSPTARREHDDPEKLDHRENKQMLQPLCPRPQFVVGLTAEQLSFCKKLQQHHAGASEEDCKRITRFVEQLESMTGASGHAEQGAPGGRSNGCTINDPAGLSSAEATSSCSCSPTGPEPPTTAMELLPSCKEQGRQHPHDQRFQEAMQRETKVLESLLFSCTAKNFVSSPSLQAFVNIMGERAAVKREKILEAEEKERQENGLLGFLQIRYPIIQAENIKVRDDHVVAEQQEKAGQDKAVSEKADHDANVPGGGAAHEDHSRFCTSDHYIAPGTSTSPEGGARNVEQAGTTLVASVSCMQQQLLALCVTTRTSAAAASISGSSTSQGAQSNLHPDHLHQQHQQPPLLHQVVQPVQELLQQQQYHGPMAQSWLEFYRRGYTCQQNVWEQAMKLFERRLHCFNEELKRIRTERVLEVEKNNAELLRVAFASGDHARISATLELCTQIKRGMRMSAGDLVDKTSMKFVD
ncbi:unnamed protein product [Amoebophrya sp. A120]|nr:unnamed protein product [Amoebophrya sp. A120]|eukprot:GSA120T00025825001.1